jgi:phosphoglycerate dehydrogenase-like enzyme
MFDAPELLSVTESSAAHMPQSRSPLKVLVPRPPAGVSPDKWWPVTVSVDWVVGEYRNNRPPLDLLPGVEAVVTTDFTVEMTEQATRLRAILIPAAGFDRVDPRAVPDGCTVTNAYHHEAPIAEWVMMCAVALDHELLKSVHTFRRGSWEMWPARHGSYRELVGRTFGIIGFGAIGRRVAKLAHAYDMRVIAAGRTTDIPAAARELGVEYGGGRTAMERVLRESDFVLISTPLIPATTGLIGAAELALMKPTAYLFNPARGHIVEEQALYEALRDNRIAGAAIDTWYTYPAGRDDAPRPSKYPFWELDNVIMTPHHSGATHGTRARRAHVVAENIDRLTRGEPLVNVVKELTRA